MNSNNPTRPPRQPTPPRPLPPHGWNKNAARTRSQHAAELQMRAVYLLYLPLQPAPTDKEPHAKDQPLEQALQTTRFVGNDVLQQPRFSGRVSIK